MFLLLLSRHIVIVVVANRQVSGDTVMPPRGNHLLTGRNPHRIAADFLDDPLNLLPLLRLANKTRFDPVKSVAKGSYSAALSAFVKIGYLM